MLLWITIICGHHDISIKRSNYQPYLEKPGEDVKLKDRDVVVAGKVDGGLESHGLQARADRVKLVESLTKCPPWHYGPTVHGRDGVRNYRCCRKITIHYGLNAIHCVHNLKT